MSVFLAGMILAIAAQLSDPSAAAPASSGSGLTLAPDPAAAQPPTPATAEAALPAGGAAPTAPPSTAAPRYADADEASEQPDPDSGLPQRSVLAAFIKPTELMQKLMQPPVANRLAGVPMTLGEAVRDARTRQEQTVRATAYWDLAAAVADYHLALLEHMELSALRQGIATPVPQWDQRLKEAQARVLGAQNAAQAAQLRLHQLLGGPPGASLPLPADAPHCGRYNAEYEEIFGGSPNAIARQLSELMPLRYAALRSQAEGVAEAETWRNEMSRRRDPAAGGLELLQAQDLLSLARRTFINTAREYNHEIARYIELAAPAEVAPDRLVAMMIRTSATSDASPWQSSGVEQAAAEQPVAAPAHGAVPPAARAIEIDGQQTFANEGYREVRRPLGRLLDRGREHSILRRPVQRLRNAID